MKVDVYKNLHKDKWSVKSREKDNYGRVIQHRNVIYLKNVTFIVHKAGRKRVLKEKRKNIHAFIRGETTNFNNVGIGISQCSLVKYNPYKNKTFMVGKKPIYKADYVFMLSNGLVWAVHPHWTKAHET